MNAMNLPRYWMPAGVVFVIFVLVLIWVWPSSPNATANAMGQGMPALPVAALRIHRQDIAVHQTLPGRTRAYEVAEVRPQVSGILQERLFVEGSEVAAGDRLYQIDAAAYRAAYNSALAALRKAEANLNALQVTQRRYDNLLRTKALSQQEYDDNAARVLQAQADVGIASAALAQAKINLDYTNVFAPISGSIGKSTVTKGALLTANQADVLTTIRQIDPIYVDMTLPSTEFNALRKQFAQLENIPVLLFADEDEQASHQGHLKFFETAVDEATGAVALRAQFANADKRLLPGLFVRASLVLDYEDVLLIPQKAAQRQADGSLILWRIAADNTVQPVQVDEARAAGDQWMIASGLTDGDAIVVEGGMRLQPGASVVPNFPAEVETPAATGEQ